MTTYHLLHLPVKPTQKTAKGEIVWLAKCGLKVAMPPQKFQEGTVVQTADKYGKEIVECAGCYAAVEADGGEYKPAAPTPIAPPPESTVDEDLGTLEGDGEVIESDDGGEVLSEESEEYPET